MGTAILVALLVLAVMVAGRLSWLWFTWQGDRLVTCPETRQPAGVALDVKHAVKHTVKHAVIGIGRVPALRLQTCTRWPERQDCGQECLAQVESAPDGCLVRNILTQ